jgi:hypothetical protein
MFSLSPEIFDIVRRIGKLDVREDGSGEFYIKYEI